MVTFRIFYCIIQFQKFGLDSTTEKNILQPQPTLFQKREVTKKNFIPTFY